MEHEKGRPSYMTRPFMALSALNFLLYGIFYLQMMVAAAYTMDILGGVPWLAGIAAGCFLLSAMVARLFTGRYIEQLGKKRMMVWGSLFYILVVPLYYFVTNAPFFITLRLLHGLGLGVSTSAIATIVVNLLPPERQGEGLSFFSLSTTLAMAVGPMLGMYLYANYSFQMILHACMILGVLSAVVLLTAKIPDLTVDPSKLKDFGKGISGLFEKSALPISYISILMYFAYSGLSSFLASYVKVIHLVHAGSLFFLVYSILIIVSRPPMGRLYDRKGAYVIIPTFLVFSLGMLLLSQARWEWMLLLSAVFIGFGFGNFSTLGRAIAVRGLPPHKLGIASSTYIAVSELGTGFGPFILGLLIPLTSFRGVYVFLALDILAALGLYLKWYGRKY